MEEKKIEPMAEFGFRPPLGSFSDDLPRYRVKCSIKILSFIILLVDLLCTYLAIDSTIVDAFAFVACGSLVCFFITILADQYGRDRLVHLTNIWIGIRLMISAVVWICIVVALFDAEMKMMNPKQQLIFALVPVSVVLHYFQFKSVEELNPKN
ncbi:hypothetical protein FO519_007241 [Halicephalobus sp. NKZ332]|nr:hypothetical protein FO519_007241 [Halicephalobus sp. NKZ332]